ncbi:hypothetical protein [Promicromonospora sp. MEB111]|uniref:hypothetical protein n=1 Tax=Promicromonospora sp. MEB111 TaxID=3040301 RepID=UPI00254C57DD|nr:hypothetical protein [Promicromonospora sp. MEB111]
MRFAICSHLAAVRVGVALVCSASLLAFGMTFTGGGARADGDGPATIILNFDDDLKPETPVGAAYAGVDLGKAVVLAETELAASPHRVLASGCFARGECFRGLEMRFSIPQQSVQVMVGLLVLPELPSESELPSEPELPPTPEPPPSPPHTPTPGPELSPDVEVEGEVDSLETSGTPETAEGLERPGSVQQVAARVNLVARDDAGNVLGSAGTGDLRTDASTPAVRPVAVQDEEGRIVTVEVHLRPPLLPDAVIILDNLSARTQTSTSPSAQTPGQGGDEPGPGGDEAGATETASAPSLLPLQIAVVVAALLAVAALLLTRQRARSRSPNVHWEVIQSKWAQTVGNDRGPAITLHARMRPEHDVTGIVRKEEP